MHINGNKFSLCHSEKYKIVRNYKYDVSLNSCELCKTFWEYSANLYFEKIFLLFYILSIHF